MIAECVTFVAAFLSRFFQRGFLRARKHHETGQSIAKNPTKIPMRAIKRIKIYAFKRRRKRWEGGRGGKERMMGWDFVREPKASPRIPKTWCKELKNAIIRMGWVSRRTGKKTTANNCQDVEEMDDDKAGAQQSPSIHEDWQKWRGTIF